MSGTSVPTHVAFLSPTKLAIVSQTEFVRDGDTEVENVVENIFETSEQDGSVMLTVVDLDGQGPQLLHARL